MVCFGDGASNIGAFHESLNLASLWKLPIVFVCQEQPVRRVHRIRPWHDRRAHRGPGRRLQDARRDG
ncbi:thiamine pyrophosphate-dependent enzyme [Streptomyces sp. KL116D]|uniref:thiamine pyrophosphate-dependent enzyme n=1 Tax=Streptomyces sp. KL116D TaxID=3045152 RepID=UPI003555E4B0